MRKQIKKVGQDYIVKLFPTFLQRLLYKWPRGPFFIKTVYLSGKNIGEILSSEEKDSVIFNSEKQAKEIALAVEIYLEKRIVKDA